MPPALRMTRSWQAWVTSKVETVGVLPNAGSRQPGGTKASGVLYSGIALPPVDRRGRIILLVDETMAAPLTGELERLERDLAGDGWTVLRHDVTRQATVGAMPPSRKSRRSRP